MLIQGINAVLNLNIATLPNVPYSLEDTNISFILMKPDSQTVQALQAEIINASEGRARVLLRPETINEAGTYKYQLCIIFSDDTIAKSAVNAFYVAESL